LGLSPVRSAGVDLYRRGRAALLVRQLVDREESLRQHRHDAALAAHNGISIFAAETYGRFDLDRRWFLQGYVGGGTFRKGSLKDEDFVLPPPLNPYSATLSIQQNGSPIYANIDAGFNVFWGPDFRVGLFGGVHYLNETVSAFGCNQIAFNPYICGAFPLPNQVKGIT